ncbi:glucose-6-phosphate 1-dehydrogenase [Abditibacterium utsteinense]|uniref:Glucose-6-phosphate 1-dehydrogenase n=1 Tax=Abditibacterium utsteinense TaxID=1960156 RepID=A0A2S8STX0_9BACT|nr:glucose-6-phosphate dehydrogenase [Abditibacterium utsteinense]PQV64240.1 glucose-6-phosphate 1-dehydrogenase [Abditibacterium utsteinense]
MSSTSQSTPATAPPRNNSRCSPSCVLTIFGATGDLTRRKLLPAIYDLAAQNLLPDAFAIVGFGRRPQDEAKFRQSLGEGIKEFARLDFDENKWNWLSERIFYQPGAYGEAEAHEALEARLNEVGEKFGVEKNRLYYLATPPEEFAPIIKNLGAVKKADQKANKSEAWRRVIVEKPFGQDLESARELNALLGRFFSEQEVFRIDHYLGKETVQNILTLRFGNVMWEPLWNNHYIDHVQIVVSEKVDVGQRAGYYETSGALRDMVVNHMFQVMSLVCMEPPVSLAADDIRDEKLKVLRAIKPMNQEGVLKNTLRGQYEGYRQAEGVAPDSKTETYVALKLEVDNWRWSGVPIYLRHGKDLEERVSEVVIRWKDTPSVLFNDGPENLKSNMMVMRIQPHDGFALRMNAKVPGGNDIKDVSMNFDYTETFGAEPPEAYERLLHDALIGDSTLFTRRDESETAWGIVAPILETWKDSPDAPHTYQPHTWGPKEADEFLARDGRRWHRPR